MKLFHEMKIYHNPWRIIFPSFTVSQLHQNDHYVTVRIIFTANTRAFRENDYIMVKYAEIGPSGIPKKIPQTNYIAFEQLRDRDRPKGLKGAFAEGDLFYSYDPNRRFQVNWLAGVQEANEIPSRDTRLNRLMKNTRRSRTNDVGTDVPRYPEELEDVAEEIQQYALRSVALGPSQDDSSYQAPPSLLQVASTLEADFQAGEGERAPTNETNLPVVINNDLDRSIVHMVGEQLETVRQTVEINANPIGSGPAGDIEPGVVTPNVLSTINPDGVTGTRLQEDDNEVIRPQTDRRTSLVVIDKPKRKKAKRRVKKRKRVPRYSPDEEQEFRKLFDDIERQIGTAGYDEPNRYKEHIERIEHIREIGLKRNRAPFIPYDGNDDEIPEGWDRSWGKIPRWWPQEYIGKHMGPPNWHLGCELSHHEFLKLALKKIRDFPGYGDDSRKIFMSVGRSLRFTLSTCFLPKSQRVGPYNLVDVTMYCAQKEPELLKKFDVVGKIPYFEGSAYPKLVIYKPTLKDVPSYIRDNVEYALYGKDRERWERVEKPRLIAEDEQHQKEQDAIAKEKRRQQLQAIYFQEQLNALSQHSAHMSDDEDTDDGWIDFINEAAISTASTLAGADEDYQNEKPRTPSDDYGNFIPDDDDEDDMLQIPEEEQDEPEPARIMPLRMTAMHDVNAARDLPMNPTPLRMMAVHDSMVEDVEDMSEDHHQEEPLNQRIRTYIENIYDDMLDQHTPTPGYNYATQPIEQNQALFPTPNHWKVRYEYPTQDLCWLVRFGLDGSYNHFTEYVSHIMKPILQRVQAKFAEAVPGRDQIREIQIDDIINVQATLAQRRLYFRDDPGYVFCYWGYSSPRARRIFQSKDYFRPHIEKHLYWYLICGSVQGNEFRNQTIRILLTKQTFMKLGGEYVIHSAQNITIPGTAFLSPMYVEIRDEEDELYDLQHSYIIEWSFTPRYVEYEHMRYSLMGQQA